jgi:transcriptional regulator with XRE-family HTH domain
VLRLRRARRWSQNMLADRAGLAEATINWIEHAATDPKLSTLEKIAEALDTDVVKLLRE